MYDLGISAERTTLPWTVCPLVRTQNLSIVGNIWVLTDSMTVVQVFLLSKFQLLIHFLEFWKVSPGRSEL